MSISLLSDNLKERREPTVRSKFLFCLESKWCSSWNLTREQLLASVEVLLGKPELCTVVSAGSFVWQGHFRCTKWPCGPGALWVGLVKGTLVPDWICCFYLSICCIWLLWKPAKFESSFFCAAQKIGIRFKTYQRIQKSSYQCTKPLDLYFGWIFLVDSCLVSLVSHRVKPGMDGAHFVYFINILLTAQTNAVTLYSIHMCTNTHLKWFISENFLRKEGWIVAKFQ